MRTIKFAIMIAATLSMASSLRAQAPAPPPAPPQPGLTLTTSAFEDGGIIPDKYTAAATGAPVSPELSWSHVPDGTVSFALITRDPDVAMDHRTDEVIHWVIFNIPGTTRELPEAVPAQAQLPDGSIQLPNRRKGIGYMAMGAGPAGPYHHYTFAIFALDTKLNLGTDATLADVESAMQGHILGKGVLVGRFHRPQ